jgi:hypothetical protein
LIDAYKYARKVQLTSVLKFLVKTYQPNQNAPKGQPELQNEQSAAFDSAEANVFDIVEANNNQQLKQWQQQQSDPKIREREMEEQHKIPAKSLEKVEMQSSIYIEDPAPNVT